jgi:polyketide synthase 12
VLITGGTGGLGALLARHLVVEHGVKSLLLASRGGADAEGAEDLAGELESLGARAQIVACDVSDRESVRALLERVPDGLPLRGVVHAAVVLDDGVIGSLNGERVERVLSPKVDAAWHLHELTADLDLSMFVLFSSAAASLGSPGQGSYAAANTFLDALAAYRRAHGLACVSMAWGLWSDPSGSTATLSSADRARMSRLGIAGLSSQEGLDLFDAAIAADLPFVMPVRLDVAALRAQADAGRAPRLLRGSARGAGRGPAESERASLMARLAAAPRNEHPQIVLELIRAETAVVLGHSSPRAVGARRAFKELGFDSLAAVELRNRLNGATGLQLAATLAFDYPTPAALAEHLVDQFAPTRADASELELERELERLEGLVSSIDPESALRQLVTDRLQALLAGWDLTERQAERSSMAERIDAASDEEIFALLDGSSAPAGSSLESDGHEPGRDADV